MLSIKLSINNYKYTSTVSFPVCMNAYLLPKKINYIIFYLFFQLIIIDKTYVLTRGTDNNIPENDYFQYYSIL